MEDMAKILIVDDKVENLFALEKVINRLNVGIVKALNGEDALRAALNHDFALAILDVQMPGMDGYELASLLRSDHKTRNIPIIFLSAVYSEDPYVFKGYESGGVDFIVKPFNSEILLSKVRVFLELDEQKAELVRHKAGLETLVSRLEEQIEARSRTERALQKAHDELERRVEERTGELITSNRQLRQEIVERERAEGALRASEAKYRELVENANSIILRTDAQGNITFFNEFAQEFFGCSEHDALGRNLIDTFIPRGDPPATTLPETVDGCLVHPEWYSLHESEAVCRSGEKRWVRWANRPILDDEGRLTGMLSVGNDITERKRMEDDLKTYTARLELVNQELQEFAFVASHDLNEPLRKIQTFADRLMNQYRASLDETANDYLTRMASAASRMQALLDALLGYSRVATRTAPFKPTDLAVLAREVVSDLEFLIERRRGGVLVGELPTVEVDPAQIRQLFQNLITNAFKFNRSAEPAVKVHGEPCSDKTCRVFIEDNGIGFDETFLDRIFKPFQRLHGRNSDYEGTGMGLAICRKIVERHSGSITAKSTPGKGTTFIVTLPVKQPS